MYLFIYIKFNTKNMYEEVLIISSNTDSNIYLFDLNSNTQIGILKNNISGF